jgi:Glycosyltransferase family 87
MLSAWIARWRRHRLAQIAVAVVGLAILGVSLKETFDKAYRPGGYDVHCFLATARAVRAGGNPYLVELPIPYNYPLFACTAAVPLTFLPEPIVHAGWFLATLAAWVCAANLLVRRLPPFPGAVWRPEWWLPLGLGSLLLFGPIQNHLLNGQTGAFVLLLCVLFWIDWHEGRGGRAALWLGIGVSLKLVPALFFVPLLMRRSWSVLGLTCVWIVVLSVALPALFLGAGVRPAYEHYARTFLLAELHGPAHSDPYGHCYTIYGTLAWLVPPWKTSLTAKVGAALLVLLPLCVLDWRGVASSTWRRFAFLETYLAAILLLTPLSETHHLTLLLPSAWLMMLRWTADPHRPLWAELLDLTPFCLFPLWKVLGGPLEFLAVAWLYVAALARAVGPDLNAQAHRLAPKSSAFVSDAVLAGQR